MTTAQNRAVQTHRQRLRERGLVRLEVQAPAGDAPWIRRLAKILRAKSGRSERVRRQLRSAVAQDQELGFKELLAAAPLEGIDLTRQRDRGRDVDL